ncbi:hypothetical protein SLS62_002114 [Diatrype stigma]|uniref:O-methyltransferase C-terminal domain-containing protein n=1 Tax=Diatrype stigma TaxID=117547 RepID=A0AAN9UUL2_9PEZI
MAPLRSISELASAIERSSQAIENGLKGTPGADFSLALGAPPVLKLDPALEATRSELLETIDELRSRVLGPLGYFMATAWPTPSLLAVLHAIYTFDIASQIPLSPDAEVTYKDLGERCGLPEEDIRRVLQTAIAFRIFEEVSPDISVRHNAVSSVLAFSGTKDIMGLLLEDNWPPAIRFSDSLKRFPGSGEPGHTAQMIAIRAKEAEAAGSNTIAGKFDDPSKGFFDYISTDEKRVTRFRGAMAFSHSSPAFFASHFVNSLPWAAEEQCPQAVVDIGGAGGELCQLILRTYPGVKKAVSLDLPEVVANVETPEDIKDRLEFGIYNFINEEVTRQADAYVFRHIFHDWSDQYAAKILRNLLPALRPGNKIWLSEVVLPELSDKNHTRDQFQRCADLTMKIGFNGKERSKRDWTNLFASVDTRFRIANITRPDGAHDSVIEVTFGA